jgi:hypothetical protein
MKDKGKINSPIFLRVSLSDLNVRPEDFQFRDTELDRHHAEELEKALQMGRDVGPMDVWRDPDDNKLYVLDGHHRFAAYTRLKWGKPIKVILHDGPLHRVKLIALRENTKARLPMSPKERADAAWRLTCEQFDDGGYSYSKKELAEATGVSERTVANMRKTYRELVDLGRNMPRSWAAAIEMAKGKEFREMTDDEREEWIAAKAAELDKYIGKYVAEYSRRCPEAVQQVLEKRMGQQFEMMIDYCASASEDEEDFPF